MPLPRMTTRRWMIAVAVVGLWSAVLVLGVRRSASKWRRSMAAAYRDAERSMLEQAQQFERAMATDPANSSQYANQAAIVRRAAARFRWEGERYERAARYPSFPVPSDPPPE